MGLYINLGIDVAFSFSFEITKRIGPVAYRLRLPEELNGVHDTSHVSNLKKCLVDPILQVPLDEIQVNAKLNFLEEPVEILEQAFKKLKRSRISIVKVRWNSKHGPRFAWEREVQMKLNSWKSVGIKRLLDDLRVTAAQVYVNAAKLNTASVKLVLLVKIEENILNSYYCLCSVNAAGE
ncbi:hypothetical protein Tco_0670943 [Tanacetum coccineum]